MPNRPEVAVIGADYYLFVVKRQWRVIIAAALLGALAAATYLVASPRQETANTLVNVNVISTDPFNAQRSASGLIDASTEMAIATSYEVASRAQTALEGDVSTAALRENSEASVVTDATVLRISHTATNASDARAGADALAAAYLSYRGEQAQSRLDSTIAQIDERLDLLRQELVDANGRSGTAAPGSSEANQAASDRDLVTIELNSLLSQRNSLQGIDTAGGSVLSPASENSLTTSPSISSTLATGTLAGLVLGLITAFPFNALDRRVRGTADIERAVGGTVLGRIPRAQDAAAGESEEALRTVRERILAAMPSGVQTLGIIDDSSGMEGVVEQIAVELAGTGMAVELLVGALSKEQAAELRQRLKLRGEGRSTTGPKRSVLHPTLTVAFPDSTRKVGLDAYVRNRIDNTSSDERPDLVILSAPSGSSEADRLATMRLADAVAILAAEKESRAEALARDSQQAHALGAAFLGVVVLSAIPRGRQGEKSVRARTSAPRKLTLNQSGKALPVAD
jgi:capsular polysaccharide biosynthesis protein